MSTGTIAAPRSPRRRRGLITGLGGGLLGLLMVLMIIVVAVMSSSYSGGQVEVSSSSFAPSAQALADIPANYLVVYRKAGDEYGLDWAWLAAIGSVETNHGRSTLQGVRSSWNGCGAAGPMQFGIVGLPNGPPMGSLAGTCGGAANGAYGTWGQYGIDGNGDGVKNVYDPADAIPGAANLLKQAGAPADWHRAVLRYNAAEWYYQKVEAKADEYRGAFARAGAAPNLSGGSEAGQGAVLAALRWIGTPYSWGGGNAQGPSMGFGRGFGTVGFDCSGLTLYAWAQQGVTLPHYTVSQYNSPHVVKVDRNELQPGDLVFFGTDLHHMAMYVGDGQMVEAPYTGANVRLSPLDSRRDYAGAVRPIPPGEEGQP